MNRPLILFCVLGFVSRIVAGPAPGSSSAANPLSPALEPDAHTLLLLQVDPAKGALVDHTGRFTPTVKGGNVIKDEQWGPCLELGNGEANGITVKDDGKISFEGGMTSMRGSASGNCLRRRACLSP